jgi:hypothetical protein
MLASKAIQLSALAFSLFVTQSLAAGDGACNPLSPACVEIFTSQNCQGQSATNFVPNCDGACIQFGGYTSVDLHKGIFSNVDCSLFSDDNCNNVIPGAGHVENTCETISPSGAGRSMKCFFAC